MPVSYEGKKLIGQKTVTTSVGSLATDPDGNTSEFSASKRMETS